MFAIEKWECSHWGLVIKRPDFQVALRDMEKLAVQDGSTSASALRLRVVDTGEAFSVRDIVSLRELAEQSGADLASLDYRPLREIVRDHVFAGIDAKRWVAPADNDVPCSCRHSPCPIEYASGPVIASPRETVRLEAIHDAVLQRTEDATAQMRVKVARRTRCGYMLSTRTIFIVAELHGVRVVREYVC